MVNSQLQQEIVTQYKLDRLADAIPSAIPVVEVGRQVRDGFIVNSSASVSGTISLIASTIRSDRYNIYITGIHISFAKDASCDIATSSIGVILTPNQTGIAATIMALPVLTLTAERDSLYIKFANPIQILSNTAINFSGTYTAGLMSRSISVIGYRDEIN